MECPTAPRILANTCEDKKARPETEQIHTCRAAPCTKANRPALHPGIHAYTRQNTLDPNWKAAMTPQNCAQAASTMATCSRSMVQPTATTKHIGTAVYVQSVTLRNSGTQQLTAETTAMTTTATTAAAMALPPTTTTSTTANNTRHHAENKNGDCNDEAER